jgi:hypothetical protein
LYNLNNSTKKSPHRQEELKISKSLISYLVNKYQLGNKFISGENFLKDHDFFLTRFFNETDYSTIFIDHNKKSTFEFKLKNPRTRTYNINEYLNTFFTKRGTVLVFKMTVDLKKSNNNLPKTFYFLHAKTFKIKIKIEI